MIEYSVLGLMFVVLVWLVHRHVLLNAQLLDLQTALSKSRNASATGVREDVAQMIDELKTTADSACNEVARKIRELKNVERELQSESPGLRCAPQDEGEFPASRILALADEGLGAMDIARQLRISTSEVELALKYNRRKTGVVRSLRRAKGQDQHINKEMAVA